MMHIEIVDIKSFINIIDMVASVIENEDLMIKTYPDYIQIHQMNATRTALISVNIGKECFDGFQCNEELVIVPISGFQTTIDTFKNFKRIVMELDRPNGVLQFLAKEGRKRKQMTIKLITEGEETTNKVDLDYTTVAKLSTTDFKNTINDCAGVGEFVVFKSSNTELRAITKGEMGSNEDSWLVGDNMDVLAASESISAFPLKVMKDISAKAEKISEKVTISLLTGAPATLIYDIVGGNIKVIIAPVLDESVLNVE